MTEFWQMKKGRFALIFTNAGIALAGIVILSFLIRAVYLGQLMSTPLFDFFSADSHHYNRVALKMLAGDFTFGESVYMNPIYPLFLAGVYAVLGTALKYAVIVQVLLDSMSCVLLYFICARVFQKKAIGLLASLIYALYGTAVFYTGFLMRATLSAFLNLVFIWLILKARDEGKPLLWLAAGAAGGISVLITSNTLLFLPFLAVWFFASGPVGEKTGTLRKKAAVLPLFFFGLLLMLLPFSLRNHAIENRFSPFSVQGGFNFYIGNHPGATGTYSPVRGISDIPVVSITDSVRLARQESGSDLSPKEASDYWFIKSFRFIRDDPRVFMLLLGRKFLLFWNNVELASNLNFYFCRKYVPVLRLPLFSYGVIAPFAMLGLLLAARNRSPGLDLISFFVVSYMLSLLLYFVSARYRFPCVPFMAILASYSVFAFAELKKSSRVKDLFVYGTALIAFFVFVNIDYFPVSSKNYFPTAHYNLGLAYARNDMLDEAIAEYKKAIEIKPDSAFAHYNLGFVYNKKGLVDKAIRKYKDAIEINPGFDQAYNDLGIAYRIKGELDKAIESYSKALEIDPDFSQVHYNLGNIYTQKEMRDKAISEYIKALELNPDFGEAHNNLAFAYYNAGDFERAVYHCDKALEAGIKVYPGFLDVLNQYR